MGHEYFTVRQAGIGMTEPCAGIRMILMAGTSLATRTMTVCSAMPFGRVKGVRKGLPRDLNNTGWDRSAKYRSDLSFMNRPDAYHLSQNPGIGNGWHNTYHDGHIQWRRFGEHEKWLPIRMSRISGNHRGPQDGNNFTGQPALSGNAFCPAWYS